MKSAIAIFTLIVLLAGARSAGAQDRYVSPTGNDGNDGTAPDNAHAWQTIQKAADESSAGMTIHVAPGSYPITTQITSSNSGTSSNPIVFASDQQWAAQIVAGSGVDQAWSNGGQYVEVIGFDITGPTTMTGGIHGQGSYSVYSGNRIHDFGSGGCYSGAGITLGGSQDNQTALGNEIFDIGEPGAVCNMMHGIYISTNYDTIQNNQIFNVGWAGITSYSDSTMTNETVSNNDSFNNGAGIDVNFTNSTVSNNILYENDYYGLYEGSSASNNQYLNNEFASNCLNIPGQFADCYPAGANTYFTSGTSVNEVDANPQFVNYTGLVGGDYHLTSASHAINAGTSTGAPSQDLDGTPRPQETNPTIGAYEFMPSLAAWWKFDNNDTTDSSGNGNTGTPSCNGTGCTNPGYGTGEIGTAVSLDGSSQYVFVADSSSMDMTDNITVAFWINPSTASLPGPRVVSKNYSWEVKLNDGEPQFSAGAYYGVLGSAVPPNTWTQIAFTYASTSQTPLVAYVNGQQVSFQTNNFPQNFLLPSSTNGLNIGAYSSGTSNFFPGEIDEVRIYNQALSASAISALYLHGEPGGGEGTCNSAPAAPSGLAASAGNGEVSLSWNASSCATSYNVYRSQTSGTEAGPAVGSPSGASYPDSGVTNNEPYYYVVAASNSYGQSAYSNEAGPAIPTAGPVSVTTCGTVGQGGDDTGVFQQCLYQTAAAGQMLEIPAGTYYLEPPSETARSAITFPNNGYMKLDSGVTIAALSNYTCPSDGSGQAMFLFAANNVTLSGSGASASVITMQAYTPTSACEDDHVFRIQGATNVTVQSLTAEFAKGGDDVYILDSTNVTVNDSIFDSAYRNAASVIGGVNHVFFNRDYFQNTTGCFNGSCFTDVGAGTDIEPNNASDFLSDVHYTDCYFNSNYNDGVRISLGSLTSASQPVSITFERAHTDKNGRYGYVALNDDSANGNPTGTIEVDDSFSGSSDGGDGSTCAAGRFWTGDGPTTAEELYFRSLSCTNPLQKGAEPVNHTYSALGSFRGGSGVLPLGNIHFYGTNITITDSSTHPVNDYFAFEDGSLSNFAYDVDFDSKGSMIGATNQPSGKNGLLLLNGTSTPCNSVSASSSGNPPNCNN